MPLPMFYHLFTLKKEMHYYNKQKGIPTCKKNEKKINLVYILLYILWKECVQYVQRFKTYQRKWEATMTLQTYLEVISYTHHHGWKKKPFIKFVLKW
jgi:hypothetical protein